jgi:hypothetical protein
MSDLVVGTPSYEELADLVNEISDRLLFYLLDSLGDKYHSFETSNPMEKNTLEWKIRGDYIFNNFFKLKKKEESCYFEVNIIAYANGYSSLRLAKIVYIKKEGEVEEKELIPILSSGQALTSLYVEKDHLSKILKSVREFSV